MFRGNIFTYKRSTEKVYWYLYTDFPSRFTGKFCEYYEIVFFMTNKQTWYIKQCPNLQVKTILMEIFIDNINYQYFTISFKRQLIFIDNKSIIPGILNLLDICDHLPYLKANKTIGNIICKNSSCWSFDVVLLCCAREKMFWQVFGNLGSQCVRSKYQILETSILREEI